MEEMFALPNAGDLLRPGCRLLCSLDHLASCPWAALPPMHPAVPGSYKMLLALSFGFFHSQRLVWFDSLVISMPGNGTK